MRPSEDFRAVEEAYLKIRERSLFNMIPSGKTYELLAGARLVAVPPRSKVPRNEVPDTIWIVIEGSVDLMHPERSDVPVEKVIGGRSIELRTLFMGENIWKYEWQSDDGALLLAVSFLDFKRSFAERPAVLDYLLKITCSPELYKLKNDLRFLGVDASLVPECLQVLQLMKAEEVPVRSSTDRLVIVVGKGSLTSEYNDLAKNFEVGDYLLWNPARLDATLTWAEGTQTWVVAFREWQRIIGSELENLAPILDPYGHGRELTRTTEVPSPSHDESPVEHYPSEDRGRSENPKKMSVDSAASAGYRRLFLSEPRIVATIMTSAFFGTILYLGAPMYAHYIFDRVGTPDGGRKILWATVAAVLAMLLANLVGWVYFIYFHHFRGIVEAKFAPLFMRHVFRMPLRFFAARRVGDITTRLGDLATVRDAFIGSLSELVRIAFFVCVYLAALAAHSFWIFSMIVALIAIMLVVINRMMKKLDEQRSRAREVLSASHSLVFEQFNAFGLLKSLGAETAARWRWEDRRLQSLRAESASTLWRAMLSGCSEFFSEIAVIATIGTGSWLYLKGNLSIGEIIAINALVVATVEPLAHMVEYWGNLSQVSLSIRRIDEVMSAEPEHDPTESATMLPEHGLSIEFKDVQFRYESDGPGILNGVTFRANPGETIAFVGKSGSGKSTLAYLVNRLLEPQSGVVRIGGVDVTKLRLADVRNRVALVIQENSIFSGTILDNITGGEEHPSIERAMRAAQMAGAHGFISRLAVGYSTVLGEAGSGLSTGQKQKINIARALYRNPSILILDEATSALDALSEDVIMENLHQPGVKRTTFIIAHRLNTVVQADRIFVLHAGRIVESGSHEDLLGMDGHYAELYRSQY